MITISTFTIFFFLTDKDVDDVEETWPDCVIRHLLWDSMSPGLFLAMGAKHRAVFWWEPWSFEVLAYFPPFNKKFFNSPWHFYYKYRLSSWIRWHILEDRICIFVLFFLFILI